MATLLGTISILNWNSCGLGNPWIVRTLQKVIQKETPALIFLMETKANLDTMKYVQNKIGFKHGLIIPSEGRSGSIALLWKIESLVHIYSTLF